MITEKIYFYDESVPTAFLILNIVSSDYHLDRITKDHSWEKKDTYLIIRNKEQKCSEIFIRIEELSISILSIAFTRALVEYLFDGEDEVEEMNYNTCKVIVRIQGNLMKKALSIFDVQDSIGL